MKLRCGLLFCLLVNCFLLRAQHQVDINDFLESDNLTLEREKKEKLAQEKAHSLYLQEKAEYNYPSFDDFWRFASEYWLVKNANALKWDRNINAKELETHFQKLLTKLDFSTVHFKIMIIPTTWVSHIILPMGRQDYLFVISQVFIQATSLSAEQFAYLLLEDMLRMKQGALFDFLKDDNFVKKLGSNFFLNKKPAIADFEALITKMTLFYRQYGYELQQDFTSIRALCQRLKKSSERDKLLKEYWQVSEVFIQNRKILTKSFPSYESLYPSLAMKKVWCH